MNEDTGMESGATLNLTLEFMLDDDRPFLEKIKGGIMINDDPEYETWVVLQVKKSGT